MHIKREHPSQYDHSVGDSQPPARRARLVKHEDNRTFDQLTGRIQQDHLEPQHQHLFDAFPTENAGDQIPPQQEVLSHMNNTGLLISQQLSNLQLNQQPTQDNLYLWRPDLSQLPNSFVFGPVEQQQPFLFQGSSDQKQEQPLYQDFSDQSHQQTQFQDFRNPIQQQPMPQSHPSEPVHEKIEQGRVKMEETMTFPAAFGVNEDQWKVENPYGNDVLSELPGAGTLNNGIQQTSGYNVSVRNLGPVQFQSHNSNQNFLNASRAAVGNGLVPQMWPALEDQAQSANDFFMPSFDLGQTTTGFSEQPRLQGPFNTQAQLNHRFGLSQAPTQSNWATNTQVQGLAGGFQMNHGLSPDAVLFNGIPATGTLNSVINPMTFNPTMGFDISYPEGTVSPKALQINPSPDTPTVPPEPDQSLLMTGNDEQLSSSSSTIKLDASPAPTKKVNAKGRTELPDKPYGSNQSSSSSSSSDGNRSAKTQQIPQRPKKFSELRPKPARSALLDQSSSAKPQLSPAKLHRQKQNKFLLEKKREGMSYKDIKREGGFTEAESTLRGRFRTLTVAPAERVRKPAWKAGDDELLRQGVRKYAKGADINTAKIPWAKVANYLKAHGASYNFSVGACSKRWEAREEK
ncbi:hypothetical protein PFICI_11513 [Pestalotiopsis fici W106-1]|uniref:Myb-like domain-containing protein n=1 Tax=Pestalotiopsis fici (strain W106-1 / CGMCC3.15140) TaxID=1229662 RepID=W3WTG5_PESFW|nr:uncharacterized protein PFICI_11513 [Pestalotiopsis fici W106-1]ETS76126.1 hypothetical protein PFICI_11513 [Pestalotiopsis fici W106-1]